ncbi:acyl-protein thioesterase 2-like protein [Tanacetum coccineum]
MTEVLVLFPGRKLMMLQKLSMVCKRMDRSVTGSHPRISMSQKPPRLEDHNGWSQLLETLPLPNIKWTCPTSPSQPLTLFSGFPSNAWFDFYFVHGKLGNDDAFPTRLDVVVGLSGWLPCAKELVNKVEGDEAAARASSLPILLFLKADWRHQLHQTPYVFVKLFKGSDDNET